MESSIKFRLAKPSDARQIAKVQYSVRDKHPLGVFSQMDLCFLTKYYKITLNDPYEVVICAENEKREIVGFNSATLDSALQLKTLKKHWLILGLAAIPSIIKNPRLIKTLLLRLKSTSKDSKEKFIYTEGARGEFWAWREDAPNALEAINLSQKSNKVMAALGVSYIFIEVDLDNENVLKYHKAMKAVVEQVITLPDGRQRALLRKNIK